MGLVDLPVDLELAEHGVGHSSFQAAERFERGLALGDLALVVATPGSVESDLGDGGHVYGPVFAAETLGPGLDSNHVESSSLSGKHT